MALAYRKIPPNAPVDASYDAVVIGAGIGGLVCANLLAKQGLKTLLVEQHYLVGGYCSTFRRKGFTFDAASHFYPLLGNPETATGRLIRELGVDMEWVKMDPVDHFHFPDGTRFAAVASRDEYLTAIKEQFPHEAEAIDRFFQLTSRAYRYGLIGYFRRRPLAQLQKLDSLSVRDVLDEYFSDPKLKLLLTGDCPHWGSPPCETSFVFDSMLRESYFLGNYYPKGGSQVFADGLAKAFATLGGDIALQTRAHRIVSREGRVEGVEIRRGAGEREKTFYVQSPKVVYNGDLNRALDHLLEPEVRQGGWSGLVEKMSATYPCYLMHVGLKGVSRERLEDVHGYHWKEWDSDRLVEGAFRFKLFVPTLYDPGIAPEGCHVLIVQKVWRKVEDPSPDWDAEKNRYEAYVWKHLRELLPEINDETALVRLSATAATSERYTWNSGGAMLGWKMSPEQMGDLRPKIESPLSGLWFVGHWAQPGGGITPVIISAVLAAESITG